MSATDADSLKLKRQQVLLSLRNKKSGSATPSTPSAPSSSATAAQSSVAFSATPSTTDTTRGSLTSSPAPLNSGIAKPDMRSAPGAHPLQNDHPVFEAIEDLHRLGLSFQDILEGSAVHESFLRSCYDALSLAVPPVAAEFSVPSAPPARSAPPTPRVPSDSPIPSDPPVFAAPLPVPPPPPPPPPPPAYSSTTPSYAAALKPAHGPFAQFNADLTWISRLVIPLSDDEFTDESDDESADTAGDESADPRKSETNSDSSEPQKVIPAKRAATAEPSALSKESLRQKEEEIRLMSARIAELQAARRNLQAAVKKSSASPPASVVRRTAPQASERRVTAVVTAKLKECQMQRQTLIQVAQVAQKNLENMEAKLGEARGQLGAVEGEISAQQKRLEALWDQKGKLAEQIKTFDKTLRIQRDFLRQKTEEQRRVDAQIAELEKKKQAEEMALNTNNITENSGDDSGVPEGSSSRSSGDDKLRSESVGASSGVSRDSSDVSDSSGYSESEAESSKRAELSVEPPESPASPSRSESISDLSSRKFQVSGVETSASEARAASPTTSTSPGGSPVPLPSLGTENAELRADLDVLDVPGRLRDSEFKSEAAEPLAPLSPLAGTTNPYSEHVKTCQTSQIYKPYISPLRCFKSFRFSPLFESLSSQGLRSATWSNNIIPEGILCSQELLEGVCNNTGCVFQHLRDLPDDTAILLDLAKCAVGSSPAEAKQYRAALSQRLAAAGQECDDFDRLSKIIVDFRRENLPKDSYLDWRKFETLKRR